MGAVTDTYEYDAFGSVMARTGSTANALTYSGEWMDEAQGLQYLRARWYSPGAGRFVSQDTWPDLFENSVLTESSSLLETPGAYQLYLYADNEPVGRYDPRGQASDDTLSGQMGNVAIIATEAGTAVAGVAKYAQTAQGQVVIAEIEAAMPRVPQLSGPITDPSRLLEMGSRVHHLLPRSAEFMGFFQRLQINVNDFCIRVPLWVHLKIHEPPFTAGGWWNDAWRVWIAANPNATPSDVFRFVGELFYKFNLPGGPIVPY